MDLFTPKSGTLSWRGGGVERSAGDGTCRKALTDRDTIYLADDIAVANSAAFERRAMDVLPRHHNPVLLLRRLQLHTRLP